MNRDGYYVTDPDDLPVPGPLPAAAGVPPGRPPIAVGTSGWGDETPRPDPLAHPIMESDLPRSVVEVFRAAGIITFGDLLRDGRDLKAFRMSLNDRWRVRRWLHHLSRQLEE